MEHEIKAIEWALEKARADLKTTGRVYRMESTREGWLERFGPDSLGSMQETYEDTCNELREVISGLEAARFTVSFDVEGEAA